MKPILPLTETGLESFEFAGFQFPKYVWTLPFGSLSKRLLKRKENICGPCYHAPKPAPKGIGFYLASDGMPGLRWRYADHVLNLNHRGWYCDDFQDQTIRGVVFSLTHGRGFLAGWSMGESMASSLEYEIYETEREAALAADECARIAAEREREFQESERAKEKEAEERELAAAEEIE